MTAKKNNGDGRLARVSGEAVRARTGKTWSQWLRILDGAGARTMSHRDIARHLAKKYPRLGMWWQQTVTVGYELARGLREKHQRPEGYEISGSRTVAAPVSALLRAWEDPSARRRWLRGKSLIIRKTARGRALRTVWGDGTSRLEVQFFPKRSGKCQVVVSHSRLKDVKAARRMKTYWAGRLDRLREILEA